MKATLLLQLVAIFAIFVLNSAQAQNPVCQPVSTNKNYAKTLFVFLVQSSDSRTDNIIKYIIKQLACTIPQADTIKSYILDYSDHTAVVTVNENDFSSSQLLTGKITDSLKTTPKLSLAECSRLQKVQDVFSQQVAVKKYSVKYIIFTKTCHPTGLPDDWFLFSIFFLNNVYWYEQDSKNAVALQISEVEAPQLLKDSSNKIIGTVLNDDSMWQTPAPTSSNDKSEWKLDNGHILLAVLFVVALFVVIGFVIYTVWNKCKGKDKKNKKGNNNSSNTSEVSKIGAPSTVESQITKNSKTRSETKTKNDDKKLVNKKTPVKETKPKDEKEQEKKEKENTKKSQKSTQEPSDDIVLNMPKKQEEQAKTDLGNSTIEDSQKRAVVEAYDISEAAKKNKF